MKRLFWLVLIVAVPFIGKGQSAGDYQSFQSGPWNDVNTWERFDGVSWINPAPTTPLSTDGVITILGGHSVNVPAGFSVTIDQTTIASSGVLQIDATGSVTVANGASNDLTIVAGSTLDVSGTLICNNAAVIIGSTSTTTIFQSGGVYEHQYTTTEGSIPLATWDATPGAASTLRITGYTSVTTASAGGNWGQSFGNVEWNCTAQSAAGNFDLAGLLTTVNGDLNVLSTGPAPRTLRFVSTGTVTLNVGGNFNVSGATEVGFCTIGTATVNVAGNYTQNLSGGYVRLVDGNGGVGTLNITGNFDLQAGTLSESGTGATQGNINFVGPAGTVHSFTEAGTPTTTLNNRLAYSVADDNELTIVGESQIAGGATSFFTLGANAILYVQSTDVAGAIQNGTGQGATTGNIRITNANRIYNAGSQIIYNGSGAQFMGSGQPTAADVTTVINNIAGVTQVDGTTLTLSGNLTLQTGDLTLSNTTLTVGGTTDLQSGDILFTSAGAARTLTFNGDVNLGGNIVVTSGAANANLVFGGDVTGGSTVSFSGINSNLTFNGTGDLVFPLAAGPTDLENLTSNRNGMVTFNETLNVNTNAGASLMSITAGGITVNGDFNGRGITLTNASSLLIAGNTTLTNTLTITDGTVQTDGTLSITNDLLITAGSLDANGSVTLTDDLTLGTNAIFYFEDQSVTLNNLLTNNGGFFSSNSGSTLNITGTGVLGTIAFDAGGNTLGAFVLNRPTATNPLVTLNSALTVDGTFDLIDGIFLNQSGLDFGAGAIVTRSSDASFNAASLAPTGGPYDLFLTQGITANMTTGMETQGAVENVDITSTGTVTIGLPLLASGNILINSGIVTSGANAISAINFTNNGTTFNAPSTTLSIGGDLVNNGAFVRNNGTVEFNGVSSISGSVNPTFQNILITGTLTSPATLNLTGNFTNDGGFNSNAGTVVFTNTANGTKTIGGSATTTFNDVTIQNNTANPDASVSGSAEIQGTLTLEITAILDADGAGSGVLTILSTDDDPTADGRIATLSGTSSVTGNVTVQRFMAPEVPGTTRVYRYLSSPVSGQFVSDWQDDFPITGTFTDPNTEFPIGSGITSICGVSLIPTNVSMFRYIEPNTGTGSGDLGWTAYPASGLASAASLEVGRGYAAFIRECTNPTLVDVRGSINQGNITLTSLVSLTSNGDAEDGYNLVGNPYPSAIDWEIDAGWTRTGISSVIAIRDNGAGGGYIYYDYSSGAVPLTIATGQAFWVRVTGTHSFVINEQAKSGNGATFYRTGEPDRLSMSLKKGTVIDKAIVNINPLSMSTLDDFDGPKLDNTLFDISTVSNDGISMAINATNAINCGSVLPLKVKDLTNGTYELSFDRLGKFVDLDMQLFDRFTNSTIDIDQTPVYSFAVTSTAASKASDRFELRFVGDMQEINLELPVASESTICKAEDALITVDNSQIGVDYFVAIEGTKVSEHIGGTGQSIDLVVPSDALGIGNNQMVIVATGACGGSYTLTQQPQITVKDTVDPVVNTPSSQCQQGSFTLSASGSPSGSVVNWFETVDASTPVSTGAEFITPILTESKTYYTSIVTAEGCEGSRVPVEATVVQYDNASITVSGDTLISNYESGNQWYRNNVLMEGATENKIIVEAPGMYKVEIQITESCAASAEMEVVITGAEEELAGGFSVYPNPVKDVLEIRVTKNYQDNIALIDSYGRTILTLNLTASGDGKVGNFDVRTFPQGFYYVKAIKSNKPVFIKIIKH